MRKILLRFISTSIDSKLLQLANLIIRSSDIEYTSGDCAAAAFAINDVLFNNKGEYIAAIDKDGFIDHVGVLYKGKIYDGEGILKSKRDLKRFSDGYSKIEYLDSEDDFLQNLEVQAFEDTNTKIEKLRKAKNKVVNDLIQRKIYEV